MISLLSRGLTVSDAEGLMISRCSFCKLPLTLVNFQFHNEGNRCRICDVCVRFIVAKFPGVLNDANAADTDKVSRATRNRNDFARGSVEKPRSVKQRV